METLDSRKKVEVCFSPYLFSLYKEEFDIIVVIDVLRATSAICAAFDNGVKELIPVSTIEEAREYQKHGYLVGAERKGQIVEGFDFGAAFGASYKLDSGLFFQARYALGLTSVYESSDEGLFQDDLNNSVLSFSVGFMF